LLVIGALSVIVYANALSNSFHFDDIQGIVRNPLIRDLKNIPSFFNDPAVSRLTSGKDWRPVVDMTYALNYAVDGLNPKVFRITNLFLHVGAAWLIFLILAEILDRNQTRTKAGLFPSAGAPLAAAALFAVHPVNTEAVDYIWARSSVLAAGFYLLSFYCFLRGPLDERNSGKISWYLAGLASFALGLGTKATLATLPVMLLLYEALFINHRLQDPLKLYWRQPKRLKKYLPIIAALIAYVVFRFVFLSGFFRRVAFSSGESGITAATYLPTQLRAWVYYIRLFIWPDPLITDFAGFGWSRSPWEPAVLAALVIIAVILALAWRARRTDPVWTFFTLWFFITLLPEASFIPLRDPVTGYRAYLANAGLAVLAALLGLRGAAWLRSRVGGGDPKRQGRLRLGYRLAAGAMLCVLGSVTIARNRVWRDEMTLWTDVAEKDPSNPRAYANLGLEFMEKKDYQKAKEMFEKAVELGPKKSYAYRFRGYFNFFLSRNDQALSDLAKAIELEPRSAANFYYRGEIYRKMREYDKALADYDSALKLLPFYTDAYVGIALVRMEKEEMEAAAETCRKLMEIDPNDARSYHCLGSLLMDLQRSMEAIRTYQKGLTRMPREAELWYGLGLAYEKYGMYSAAGKAFETFRELTAETKRRGR
jgi:tetratricopeptide (TPR) repeat protein